MVTCMYHFLFLFSFVLSTLLSLTHFCFKLCLRIPSWNQGEAQGKAYYHSQHNSFLWRKNWVHLLHDRHHFVGVTRPEVMCCKLRNNLSLSLSLSHTHTHTHTHAHAHTHTHTHSLSLSITFKCLFLECTKTSTTFHLQSAVLHIQISVIHKHLHIYMGTIKHGIGNICFVSSSLCITDLWLMGKSHTSATNFLVSSWAISELL